MSRKPQNVRPLNPSLGDLQPLTSPPPGDAGGAFRAAAGSLSRPDFEKHIREMVAAGDAIRLPTLRELARNLDVPRPWVESVVRQLRDEGLLRVRRRGGISFRRLESHAPAQPVLAREEALYRLMRSRIESGIYRTGQPLPKTGFVARSEKVWTLSVGRVYRRLASDGFARRAGRSYIVGQSDGAVPDSSHKGKCVLMIELNEFAGQDPRLSWWTMPFAQSLMREMSLYGVEPRNAFFSRSSRPPPWPFPAGRAEIAALVKELGDRLLGTLIISVGAQFPQRFSRTFYPFFEWLCTFDRPVVYFDSPNDAGYSSARPESHRRYVKSVACPLMQKHFVRCYPDYDRAGSLPVELLGRFGHRLVGFGDAGNSVRWMRTRLSGLAANAAKMSPPLRIVSSRECPPLFGVHPELRARDFTREVKRSLPLAMARHILEALAILGRSEWSFSQLPDNYKGLVHLTAHLGALVTHPGLTALIAPSDRHARFYYRWLQAAGIRVPHDLSLISFDDRQERLYPYSISSVNYGFDDLGFVAFHLLLGDMPVKPDALRSVKSRCRINHLATMGTPGRRRV